MCVRRISDSCLEEAVEELHDEAGACLFGIAANASSIQTTAGQLDGERATRISSRAGEILSIAERLKVMNRGLLKKLRPGPLGQVKLTDLIVEDGGTPWCIGLGSGAATGWPATDWVEEMMLRTQPPAVYDQWVSNEMKFDDPAVIAAMEEFGYFALNEDYVDGGTSAVANTDFRDSPAGLFSIPPKCYMHRQASFIPAFFPEGTEAGEDVDFFYFPAYESKDLGKPVLGAGALFAITNPSEATNAMIEFLQAPISHELWMAQGGFLTPHKGVNPENYMTDALRGQGEILVNATTFRFDGSDLMPGGVGAGSFWTAMVDYTGGADAAAAPPADG